MKFVYIQKKDYTPYSSFYYNDFFTVFYFLHSQDKNNSSLEKKKLVL